MKTLSNGKETKARKEHKCNFCGGRIPIRDKYINSTHVYDGEIYDWKTHTYCDKLASDLNMYDDCDEGVTQDDFVQYVSDKHWDVLLMMMDKEDRSKYSEVLSQAGSALFRTKLSFVIRHLKK